MKNIWVVSLVALGLGFAGAAEAAKSKKRTRNANRVGAYAVGFVSQVNYTKDPALKEFFVEDFITSFGPTSGITTSTKDHGIGYQAAFGYRFNRYLAAEIGLGQFGSTKSTSRGQVDFGDGLEPASGTVKTSAGGVTMAVVGVLPINDKFELFGRAGIAFLSNKLELTARTETDSGLFGSVKSDSQNALLGVGAAWHFNQQYSARFEYSRMDDIGTANTGKEDISSYGLGVVIRF